MSTRKEQQETSVGGQKNLGSNGNAEGTRQVTNRERVGHIVVEAHGAVPEFTKDQHSRKHEQAVFESKGESGKRSVVKSGVTLGRHVTSKSGAQVASERAAEVRSIRTKREKTNLGK